MDCNIKRMLISEEAIRSRIDELATEIARDYKGRKPLLIGILKGSVVFMADLIRKIDIPIEIDFMSVSSYGNDTSSSGVVRILKDLDSPITGRDVLIIEDILDSGLTLGYLTRVLGERQPKSIKICSLLYKMRSADEQLPIDISYLGFAIENEFVIGYGLDYAGFYRNLPFIGILDEKAYSNE